MIPSEHLEALARPGAASPSAGREEAKEVWMRRILLYTAVGLVPILWLVQAGAQESKIGKAGKVKPPSVIQPQGETCGDFGTSVKFEGSPSEAAKKAIKEEKLVFVLHVSGDFEDPDFT